MSKRAYGQFCGLVRALELVGERWALLIVRDLLVRPRRYGDLRRGLPRIPTNILAARLRELEESGVVRRRLLDEPGGAVVYELTEYGRELDDAVARLSRWGARSLGEPRPGEIVTADSMIMALRTTFRAESARDGSYELRFGPVTIHARVADGGVEAGEGPLPGADLLIEAGPGIRALMAGEIDADEAITRGIVRVEGDPARLAAFAETFRI